MKKMILILLIMALVPLAAAVSQTPPSDITFGMISKNGGDVNYTIQASGNINIIKSMSAATEVSSQAYVQLGVLFADDIYFNEGTIQELEAITGYAVVEKFLGKFSLGTGIGVMAVQREGDNDYKAPFLFKASYDLFSFARIGVQAQYVPIKNEGDLVFAGLNIGITP